MKTFIILFALFIGVSQARTWTDTRGRTIEAEIVRADDTAVIVKRDGKEVRLPLDMLCDEDREFIEEWREGGEVSDDQASDEPSLDEAALEFDGKPLITGGKMNLYEYDYPAEVLDEVQNKFKREDSGYKIAIAVPNGFDPSKPQRIFFANTAVNNEQERAAGNIQVFGNYSDTCIKNGWVCIAYDSDIGRPPGRGDTDLYQTMAKLNEVWPNIRDWEFAVGGFSGGSKACFFPCAYLVKYKYKVLGAFLGGCNHDTSGVNKERLKAPSSGYRDIKVFLSTGKNDDLVSEEHLKNVMASLKKTKMRIIRNELFDGGHSLHLPHFDEALKWFADPTVK